MTKNVNENIGKGWPMKIKEGEPGVEVFGTV
jgi:hypothetical protein